MSEDDSWITHRVTEARRHHPLVTERVAGHMDGLLKGELGEVQLSSSEGKSIARELLREMVAAPPSAGADR